jgi:hypothetical protein
MYGFLTLPGLWIVLPFFSKILKVSTVPQNLLFFLLEIRCSYKKATLTNDSERYTLFLLSQRWASLIFFKGPLIANPLIFFLNPLNANTLIFKVFQSANR